ncbi:hypothetical protein [uncultured Thiodictyon sp.]|nr:hypothetical protein [uncultured Thiodictyon sp.]
MPLTSVVDYFNMVEFGLHLRTGRPAPPQRHRLLSSAELPG